MCPLYHTHIMVYGQSNAIFISHFKHKICDKEKIGKGERGTWDEIWHATKRERERKYRECGIKIILFLWIIYMQVMYDILT